MTDIPARMKQIDVITDATGDVLTVNVINGNVSLLIEGENTAEDGYAMVSVHLDAALRERFMRAYMEAERQAEANAAARKDTDA